MPVRLLDGLLDDVLAGLVAGFEVSGMYPVNREDRSGRVLDFDCLIVRASALG